jgi:serine-type D-Ala-D-Ala carboxypeptidase/endopeptidase (penicillin-binding protein 4)
VSAHTQSRSSSLRKALTLAAACLAAALCAITPTASAATPLKRLRSQLTAALSGQGGHVGVLVEDVSSGAVLYSRAPTVTRPPASVEKLYTTAAAINLLGPSTRFPTEVAGTGKLEHGGVWHGNLYLRGGGDPTFGDGTWNRDYASGYGPTAAEIVTQLRKAGIRRVTGHIYADETLFDRDRGGPATDNKADTPDYGGEMSSLVYDHGMSADRMSPAVFAAHELALTMRSSGMRVSASPKTRRTPVSAFQLARVESPPLSVLLRLMDVPSDDLIADMLVKQMGAQLFGEGSLSAGAIEVSQSIASDYGLKPIIHDGSGLDHADRTSPDEVVSLLRQVWQTPTGNLLHASLPVVGEQGTVKDIGLHSPAADNCVAKTGTLNNVTNLAGYCTTKAGPTVAFALMIDGPSNYAAIPALSRGVAAIARY